MYYLRTNNLLISSSARETIKDSVKLAQELGTGIEISRIPLYKNKQLTLEENINILKSDLKGFKNRITMHAMFSDVNVSSSDCIIKEISEKRCFESFETGKSIGADIILFHTGNKGTLHYGSIETFKKNYIAFWKDFIIEFEKSGITAVAENVFETTPDFCIDLYEAINSNNFKLALDTGHVNLYAQNTKVTDWIKAYGNRLRHIHIHNNFGKNDDHSNLENGTLNFKEIFEAIKKENITPSFVLEMFTEEDIRKSEKIFKREYLNSQGEK